MFMFRTRRSLLVKRLWKSRCRRCEDDNGESCEENIRSELLRRLRESELEVLLGAVESQQGSCVLLRPRDHYPHPHLLSCKTWRWPDLQNASQLKRIPSCQSSRDQVCLNPYHWSRLCIPDSPPPPYTRFNSEKLKPEDRAPSESTSNPQLEMRGSLSTNGEGDGREDGSWCRLAYWELAQRVGRQYSVQTDHVNVFWNMAQGQGLCLATLAKHTPTSEPVKRAREKIGRGVTLSREADGIWAYNQSETPVFVNSPCLDDPESRSLLVYRVPPGYCLNIFNGPRGRQRVRTAHHGPIDPNSVRISFVKGWGPKYSRQEVTACPTWLEVLLAPCR